MKGKKAATFKVKGKNIRALKKKRNPLNATKTRKKPIKVNENSDLENTGYISDPQLKTQNDYNESDINSQVNLKTLATLVIAFKLKNTEYFSELDSIVFITLSENFLDILAGYSFFINEIISPKFS